ncbi:3-keto-5-aminohexanoate cleavage protein [Bradyrhizobium sp. LM6.9]
MGLPYGEPRDLSTLMALVHQLPPRSVHSAFSIGWMQLPYVGLARLVGANLRVGLEDNLYLSQGRLTTNAELVERAVQILERIGVRDASGRGAGEARAQSSRLRLKIPS